jgi:hypothetical protein
MPGTVVKATGWYDNSKNNPANPDPTKTVRWGPQTTDEMMLGYVEYILPVGSKGLGDRPLAAGIVPASLFKRIDTNNDGKISRAEYDAFVKQLPRFRDAPDEAARLFELLDADRDGMISPKEFERLKNLR